MCACEVPCKRGTCVVRAWNVYALVSVLSVCLRKALYSLQCVCVVCKGAKAQMLSGHDRCRSVRV